MVRISSRCLVAFSPSPEVRALKRLFFNYTPNFEIEFQFQITHSFQFVKSVIPLKSLLEIIMVREFVGLSHTLQVLAITNGEGERLEIDHGFILC
jgi:hypothetical protein